jgi:hypothetical protein
MMPVDPADVELLSAYLDDALTGDERANVAARLGAEPSLRATLDDLRLTRSILRAAPVLAPPRNFTLDPAKYARKQPPLMRPVVTLRWVVAVAALLIVAVVVRSVLINGSSETHLAAGNAPVVALAPTNVPAATTIPSTAPATSIFENGLRITSSPSSAAKVGGNGGAESATAIPSATAVVAAAANNAVSTAQRAASTTVPIQPSSTVASSSAPTLIPASPLLPTGTVASYAQFPAPATIVPMLAPNLSNRGTVVPSNLQPPSQSGSPVQSSAASDSASPASGAAGSTMPIAVASPAANANTIPGSGGGARPYSMVDLYNLVWRLLRLLLGL